MIGKKVRLTDEELEWYLSHEAFLMHCIPGDTEFRFANHEMYYDLVIETMLLMAMFPDEFPGTVMRHNGFTDSPAYRVDYPLFYTWHEPETLIVE